MKRDGELHYSHYLQCSRMPFPLPTWTKGEIIVDSHRRREQRVRELRCDSDNPLDSRVYIITNLKSKHSSLRRDCNSWLRQRPCKNFGNPRLERPLHPLDNRLECSLKLIHTRQRTAVANDSLLGIKNLLTKVS